MGRDQRSAQPNTAALSVGDEKHHESTVFFVGEFSGVSGRVCFVLGREGLEASPPK